MEKTYTITLKSGDLKKDYTMSGELIDELAYAIGQWTNEDLFRENAFYSTDCWQYVYDNFDYEEAYIKKLNSYNTKQIETEHPTLIKKYKKQNLKLGAFIALKYPKFFAEALKEWIEHLKEDGLDGECKELRDELEEAENSFWTDMKKEWLYGDYGGNCKGIIRELAEWLGCEKATYNEKTDEMSLTYTEEQAEDELNFDYYHDTSNRKKLITLKALKSSVISGLEDGGYNENAKHTKEAEEHKAERERLAKYKAEQKAEAESERKAKLLAMKKTK